MVNPIFPQISSRKVSPVLVVTGLSGFIGRRLRRLWLNQGRPIIDARQWHQIPPGSKVRVVHLAGMIHGPRKQVIQTNLRLTAEAIDLARKLKAEQFILISSIKVLGQRQTAYSRSKKMSETLVEGSGLPHIILRLGQVFGPGDDKNFDLLLKWLRRVPIAWLPGNGKFRLQPIQVDNVVELITKLAQQPVGDNQVLTVVGPEKLTWSMIMRRLEKYLHKRLWRVRLPTVIFKWSDIWQSLLDNQVYSSSVDWKKFKINLTKFPKGLEDE